MAFSARCLRCSGSISPSRTPAMTRVSLQSTSHVEGDVYHQALVMEQGAFFEGKSTRSDDPLAAPPASELAAPNSSGEA
jgi:cytoskeletal protein CcmA (bactofilin family)